MRISEYPIRPSREAETQPFRGKPRTKIKNKTFRIIKTSAKIETLYHTLYLSNFLQKALIKISLTCLTLRRPIGKVTLGRKIYCAQRFRWRFFILLKNKRSTIIGIIANDNSALIENLVKGISTTGLKQGNRHSIISLLITWSDTLKYFDQISEFSALNFYFWNCCKKYRKKLNEITSSKHRNTDKGLAYEIVHGEFNFQILSFFSLFLVLFVYIIYNDFYSLSLRNLGKILPYESPIFSKIIGIRAYGLRSPKWVGI